MSVLVLAREPIPFASLGLRRSSFTSFFMTGVEAAAKWVSWRGSWPTYFVPFRLRVTNIAMSPAKMTQLTTMPTIAGGDMFVELTFLFAASSALSNATSTGLGVALLAAAVGVGVVLLVGSVVTLGVGVEEGVAAVNHVGRVTAGSGVSYTSLTRPRMACDSLKNASMSELFNVNMASRRLALTGTLSSCEHGRHGLGFAVGNGTLGKNCMCCVTGGERVGLSRRAQS